MQGMIGRTMTTKLKGNREQTDLKQKSTKILSYFQMHELTHSNKTK
jgi:hypothetical protein